MFIVPKEKPVHIKLNSFYLDLNKFLEYYQKVQGAGCIHLFSSNQRGIICFDTDEIIKSVYQGDDGSVKTNDTAFQELIKAAQNENMNVDLYHMDQNYIYNWANLYDFPALEKNISSEQFSFEDTLKQYSSLKLTGYIEAVINDLEAILFFQDGQIVFGSYSWGDGSLESHQENIETLISKSLERNGTFHVFGNTSTPEKLFDVDHNMKGKIAAAPSSTIATLEELFEIFERVVENEADTDSDFDMLLKNKFVSKASIFSFLDPFAGEFNYDGQKISFTGKASNDELTLAVTECVRELADELGVLHILKKEIKNWSTYLGADIAAIGKRFL